MIHYLNELVFTVLKNVKKKEYFKHISISMNDSF